MQQVILKEYSESFNLTHLFKIYLNNDHYLGRLVQFNKLWKHLVVTSLKLFIWNTTLFLCMYFISFVTVQLKLVTKNTVEKLKLQEKVILFVMLE